MERKFELRVSHTEDGPGDKYPTHPAGRKGAGSLSAGWRRDDGIVHARNAKRKGCAGLNHANRCSGKIQHMALRTWRRAGVSEPAVLASTDSPRLLSRTPWRRSLRSPQHQLHNGIHSNAHLSLPRPAVRFAHRPEANAACYTAGGRSITRASSGGGSREVRSSLSVRISCFVFCGPDRTGSPPNSKLCDVPRQLPGQGKIVFGILCQVLTTLLLGTEGFFALGHNRAGHLRALWPLTCPGCPPPTSRSSASAP